MGHATALLRPDRGIDQLLGPIFHSAALSGIHRTIAHTGRRGKGRRNHRRGLHQLHAVDDALVADLSRGLGVDRFPFGHRRAGGAGRTAVGRVVGRLSNYWAWAWRWWLFC